MTEIGEENAQHGNVNQAQQLPGDPSPDAVKNYRGRVTELSRL